MKSVLVTGATGFIGHYLVSCLLDYHCAVRILVSKQRQAERSWEPLRVETVLGDIRETQSVSIATKGIDTVFHLAGKAHEVIGSVDNIEYETIIADGTLNVLRSSINNGVS